MGDRKREILLGSGLLVALVVTIWFAVGRESGGSSSVTPTKRVERASVNAEEQKTMEKQEEEAPKDSTTPNSQDNLLREETSRAARENAIRNFKEGN